MASANDIRRAFLDFFTRNGHEAVPSSPLVPRNDPTLMFTNAGMVQFKNVFTGQETRPYVRAASSQKCVRAGGKHNDLDNVGYTARHHTFFEMLGNFSFGDYFKADAIPLAWELLTKDFALDPKRLTITVYHTDDEAFDIWKKVTGFADEKIIRIPTNDNFWQMGDTGPCGPCSEIFYDHGEHIFGGPPGSPDQDGDRFVEIWNLVFMQFEQLPGGERIPLPKQSVDTGMGLERVAAVLQGVTDNYDIDLFKALIAASVQATGVPATGENRASHRVIADHLRASSFLIADGVLPSNEGRGYVLRRIMRRAMRHAHLLGAQEPLMHRLVPSLVHEMGDTYHELQRAQPLIAETLLLEEKRFKRTLEKGLGLLGDATSELNAGDVLSGETAFKLYDTFGFPLDLTEDALRARSISVDTKGFETAMQRQKAEARKAWKGSGEAATESIWFEIAEKTGATEFLGYDTEQAAGEIVALVKDGKAAAALGAGDEGAVIVNQTPFYGESGGQVGDVGIIAGPQGALFRVTDTLKKAGGVFVHVGKMEAGSFKSGETVDLTVDHNKRSATRANHSATHLLHEALRQVLGSHVAQKGSMVSPGRLRFDFSHTKPMAEAELAEVEARANAIVLQNSPVETRLMALEDAMQSGAMALFGEKYGDEVRVVAMGDAGPNANKAWSVELCGGTHVKRTGDIGLVKIVAESGSAAGVRRIEALTADAARGYLSEHEARVREIASALHVRPEDVAERVKALVDERKQLERQLAEAKKQLALSGGGGGAQGAGDAVREVGKVKLLARTVQGLNPKDLRGLIDEGKKQVGSGVVAIVGVTEDGKAGLAVGVTADLTASLSAVDLVKAGADALGGKGGGGRPDMAQAGGPDGAKAGAALEAIEAVLASA
ncbi:Alanyl-tRNA synthetase [Hyphomicrobium sulfonivorans]|uniref:Alanine--tRNA ligase n=1 Tax=Hyphomicrobium sulfonivorans TaxID=121290 RepID=A0A109B9B8_HYPSL|nr:alanine--tRNA ligase [Hyphomicrobium sulfonivorans]KWT64581.1 Alanyl-tRNA synthetase [Hyphomicrobium sulfonivorans]